MYNRAAFWSASPDFSRATLQGEGIAIASVATTSLYWVSGDPEKCAARFNLDQIIGPRQLCNDARYGLRVAPDCCLFVSENTSTETFNTFDSLQDGCVITDISDGMLLFDISGAMATELMAQASGYAFTATQGLPEESALMRFAGFKLAVSRRERGWRLHIERSWAPALWHWLQVHVEQG